MKQLSLLLIFLLAATAVQAAPAAGKSFSVTLGAGVRTLSGDEEDVYDSFNLVFSLDLAYRLGKSFEICLHSDYLSAEGELSITQDPTTLTVLPVEAGVRYLLGGGTVIPYIGAGAGFYSVKEDNVIGTVNETSLGFFAEGGVRFAFAAAVFADLKAKYTALSITPENNSINLGGFSLSGGIGFSF